MDKKLDLFKTLGQIDRKNYQAFSEFDDGQRKEFAPYVYLRWLSGTSNKQQVVLLNEFVNPVAFYFTLKDHSHKELLFKLMTVCTSGSGQRYSWSIPKRAQGSKPLSNQVVRQAYRYNFRKAEDALKVLTAEDVVEMAEQQGKQKDEIKLITKEWK